MRTADPIGLAKAILWAEAKGKLHALADAEGQVNSTDTTYPRVDGKSRWEIIEERVEAFIKEFEEDGLHE